jgi:hypothetical protein
MLRSSDSLTNHRGLPLRRIIKTWWPLAASWLLMGAELPVLSAVVARLANPEINLAAYGGVVFPLALIIEAPIIMLLAASTALSKDWDSYCKLYRFMMASGLVLTVLHILLAFTPLYYLVANGVLGVPPEIIEPSRIGLMIMTPWTWAIAYRRFNQGVLIRFGRSHAVGVGTVVRLIADGLVLAVGYLIGSIPGIVVATCAVAAGVVSEAIYAGWVVQPVIKGELRAASPVGQPLTLRSFLAFYIPLAMTSLISLLANPIGSAALSRMPEALASLAVWPVVTGLIFMLRSLGIAFNEVVVALLDEPDSSHSLRRFAVWLSAVTTVFLLIVAATPLSSFWFLQMSALPPHLASLATLGLWIAVPLPALTAMQSWYQGAILHGRQTGGITESVVLYLVASAVIMIGGVLWGKATGLYIGLIALGFSTLIQTVWLWLRSREVRRAFLIRDRIPASAAAAEALSE